MITVIAKMIRAVIPYIEGLAEDVGRVCRDYAVQVVFKSGPTLKEKLTIVKDQLPIDKS